MSFKSWAKIRVKKANKKVNKKSYGKCKREVCREGKRINGYAIKYEEHSKQLLQMFLAGFHLVYNL
jgi:hypothetical protein